MSIERKILELYRLPAYQKLNAYYGQSTVFNVLGVERNENCHSAFLAWFLNPEASHSLNDIPLRKFLALAAARAQNENQSYWNEVKEHLVTGNYKLEVEDIKSEQSIIGLANDQRDLLNNYVEKNSTNNAYKTDSQNRFDIWILARISYTNAKDEKTSWTIPVVVENKIYSSEGHANDKDKAQTVRYHRAICALKNVICPNEEWQPIFVFLTPEGAKAPTSKCFIPLTYQELLDNVIQPSSLLSKIQNNGSENQIIIDSYIRILSQPARGDDEGKAKDYSILAISQTESSDLKDIFSSEVFQKAFCAIYPKEAKILLDNAFQVVDEDIPLLEQCWNTNENLFKIALYNQYKEDKDKLKIVRKIVKVSNRDNTRYFIGLQVGNWLNTKGRPASKSEASFLIFKAYCIQQHQQNPDSPLTLDELRTAFDGSLNAYYYNRFFQHLFYDFNQEVTVESGRYKGTPIYLENNTWDFYGDDGHQLPFVEGDVRNVKMWRKNDFDNLVKIAKEKGIIIEPVG